MTPVINDNNNYDPRESQFFSGLPLFVQESIMQSAGMIHSDEELRATAEQLIRQDNAR
jgi:hypothetical protein